MSNHVKNIQDRDLSVETKVRDFYNDAGWSTTQEGVNEDARLWEDLRPAAADYVRTCRLKLLEHLPKSGNLFLDAASGPIQYPEYLEYSKGFNKRVCVDISQRALDQARLKLGERGEYVCVSILELPFPDNHFDAVASLHTIYHIDKDQQEAAVRQLIRVAKPGAKIVILYANPDRLLARLKRLVNPAKPDPFAGPIYYYAHPLDWWARFADSVRVHVYPWRALTAKDSRRLIPDNRVGHTLFSAVGALEKALPGAATALGAYPMIVMEKKSSLRPEQT